ncbi:MAG TPA: ClpXP protease specificity-enhancing factor SspB [Acetobacteraceae bacterium]|jgi:hypothetical protein|nr:ClpXP protease specificity-enhancing factor SspB [Acetobacteraceae bacterium]
MTDEHTPPVESLLPYEDWTEAAMREVVARALSHVAENGLPGDHHFYITFRTDYPGVVIPPRLRAQYPREMTIVLQHQFWDLRVHPEARLMTVGLSFGGVPSTLTIPLGAIIAFADPYVRYGMRFRPEGRAEGEASVEEPAPPPRPTALHPVPEAKEDSPETEAPASPQVVSLDAFRRRPPSKD